MTLLCFKKTHGTYDSGKRRCKKLFLAHLFLPLIKKIKSTLK